MPVECRDLTWPVSPPESKGSALRWSIVSAAGALLLAWYFRWQARDLAWSLWLSSLVLGYATLVSSLFRGRVTVPLALARLAFFTFHFGLFHFIHSGFLSFLLPLEGVGEGPSLRLYASVFRDYWPMVLASGVAAIPRLCASRETSEGVVSAYMGIVRLHVMIFALAVVSFLGADHFLAFALVYLLSLLPLEARMERLIERSSARRSERLADFAEAKQPRRRHPRGDDDAVSHASDDR